MGNYKADSNQLSFLQLLSGRAAQTITFHCKNTVAFRNPRGNTRNALSLMSWNDLEIKKGGNFKYEVVEGGCKERAKTWSKSIFTVDTTKPTRHPQAAYCGCAGEGHWQVKAGLQGGSRPGLLQLIQKNSSYFKQSSLSLET